MVSVDLSALMEALRRTVIYIPKMLTSGRHILLGALSNNIKRNLPIILVAAVILGWAGWKNLAISLSGASISIVALGTEVSTITIAMRVARFFSTPFDEIIIGSLVNIGIVLTGGILAYRYFISTYIQLSKGND